MPSRKDCIGDIAKRTGRKRQDVEDTLEEILDKAEGYQHDGMGPDEAYAKARDERLAEISERAALRRRAEIMDLRKDIARTRFYKSTADAIKALPVSPRLAAKLAVQAARLAMEAKLVGVNLPFLRNRISVDAQFMALRRLWVGGMARDLDQAGLLKIFASRKLEDKWTDELFELNRKDGGGNPGKTGDKQALEIAKTIQKWQRESMAVLNREGAWVKSYSGYITRSSHDADAIKHAGQLKWTAETLPLLDLKRTFGTSDPVKARDALGAMWDPFARGDHYDYGKPIEEGIYPNVARQASDSRELHFKDGAAWRTYNEKYGVSNATHTVVRALEIGARRTALMKEFGTRPAEAFDRDIAFLKQTLQSRRGSIEKLNRLQAEQEAAPTQLRAEAIATLDKEIREAAAQFEDFASWEQPLRNRFAQIDGSSQRPVNRTLANITSNWMAIQRMAKLGRVALTHFASLPTKAAEARYWGIPFAERYGSLFRGLTQGLAGSAKREALDATLVAFENRLGHMMALYDVADAPAGHLAKWETLFFKLTGVSSVIDNQRGDAEAMFASHLGAKRGRAWAEIGPKEQRVLQGFGIGEAEWKALHGVEWSKFGDRTYLTPSDALKLSDDQVRAYMKEAKAADLQRAEPTADDIARARQDLALQLATTYSDRAGFAIPMPSARIRAMLFGKNFEPGTGLNAALKLVYQFKIWPADMIVRAWGREIYGRVGDGRLDRVAGLVEQLVGFAVFGVAAEGVRELIQGKDPIHKLQTQPIQAIMHGLERSGFGSLLGDYLLGQYDRHGLQAVAQLAGPTFSQIDNLMGIIHGAGEGDSLLNAIAGVEGPHKGGHPWRNRATSLLKLTKENTPFMSLWATSWATDALIWHRLQEWMNPGYLARAERRQRDQQGIHHWVSPAKTDQWITGKRASPF